jgi:hypothetical protein
MARCSMFDSDCREQMLARLHRLTPESQRRWGRMSAPQMIAHLSDQMRHALGDVPVAARPGILRWAPVRYCGFGHKVKSADHWNQSLTRMIRSLNEILVGHNVKISYSFRG